ncbi:MAG TPA: hypothetical protein VG737_15970 [Cyclobacteriaceae bacterium]|nr:hypothetical protein [Cyclobacteriaceae bacterium]
MTDLIYCIENVDELDAQNDFLKKGFKDEYFQKSNPDGNALDIVFFTSKLKAYIRANKNTLKAVFFTRKTGKGIDRIWKEWLSIKNFCESMNIHSTTLCSPSPRGGGIRTKIHDWRCAISPYVTK